MTRVLVTGAGGFIGSHLTRSLLNDTDWHVVAMDSFRHRGVVDRLTVECDGPPAYSHHGDHLSIIRHDLAAPVSPQMAARIGQVDVVFALASGSHVDTSISSPREFAENNVAVGLTTLEYVREFAPEAHLVLVSTDEVYGPVDGKYLHPEWDAIVPSNPYSASKASQEAMAVAWWRSYGLKVTIVNMHNVYGPMQHPEKFVPKVIGLVRAGRSVPIHGTGRAGEELHAHGSRHWLHVADVANALVHVSYIPPVRFNEAQLTAQRPNRWNIASMHGRTNLDMARLVAQTAGCELHWHFSDARPGRDHQYGLTNLLLADHGWQPMISLERGIRQTVDWYEQHPEWLTG